MSTERERQQAVLRAWVKAHVRVLSGSYTAGIDPELSELPRSSQEHLARIQLQMKLAETIARRVKLDVHTMNGMLVFSATIGVVFDYSLPRKDGDQRIVDGDSIPVVVPEV